MTEHTIGIVGAGSWGTAMAVNWARSGRRVLLWARSEPLVAEVSRSRRSRYLPSVEIPEGVELTADLRRLAECQPVVIAVASHGVRETVRDLLRDLPPETGRGVAPVLVSASKGVEAQTSSRMSEVLRDEGRRAGREIEIGVLSGPTFAEEVAQQMPSAAVVAAADPGLDSRLQSWLSSPSLRLYTSADVVGVEIAGTAKNVIAIAAGVLTGLGLGHNTLAALITRGLHEITRLGVACGGDPRTFAGLAGLGDLVLTCTGGLSRNRQVGMALASGKALAQVQAEMLQVAEGVRNSSTVAALARSLDVEMPITEQMVAVLHEGKSPREALGDLMRRELKRESEL